MSVISHLPQRSGWTRVPFGRVTKRVKDCGRSELEPLSVFLDDGVVPRSSRNDNHNQLGEDLGRYLIVQPGDIVFNKLRTWQGGLGVSKYTGIVSPAYFVCRPNEDYESRFLHYLLRSTIYLQELTRISKWQPPAQFDIGWEQLRGVQIIAPSKERQVAIADYLDTKTTRIDALIEKKKRMIKLLDERRWAKLDKEFEQGRSGQVTSLKRLALFFADGDWIESPFITDSGIKLIQTGNIGRGEFREQGGRYISDITFSELQCTEVFPGDVLISRLANTVGQACVAPDVGSRMVASVDVVILRPAAIVLADFLVYYMSTNRHLSLAGLEARGTTMQRLARSQVGDLPIAIPPLEDQRRAVLDAKKVMPRLVDAIGILGAQIDLLQERRRALITAAVTGEIEVPGVAA